MKTAWLIKALEYKMEFKQITSKNNISQEYQPMMRVRDDKAQYVPICITDLPDKQIAIIK